MDTTAFFSKHMILHQALTRMKTQIHFIPEFPGVQIPEGDWRRPEEDVVRLNLSRRFKDVDLVCTPDEPVQATLSFKGQRFRISVPWEAIVAVDPCDPLMPTIIFPIHPDAVAMLDAAPQDEAPQKKERPSWLRVVKEEEETEQADA